MQEKPHDTLLNFQKIIEPLFVCGTPRPDPLGPVGSKALALAQLYLNETKYLGKTPSKSS